MNYFDDEQPKYRKKSRKPSVTKSKHKHVFEEVMVVGNINDRPRYYVGERCCICGKTKSKTMFFSERGEDGMYRLLTNEEILKKYPNLPKVKEVKFDVFEDIPGEKYATIDKDDMIDG